jgi:hypothetical protein
VTTWLGEEVTEEVLATMWLGEEVMGKSVLMATW